MAAIGINCTAPQYVSDLIDAVRSQTRLPILAYPNSGEGYDATSKTWLGDPDDVGMVALAEAWVASGAKGVGGCCRVGPDVIAKVRGRLVGSSSWCPFRPLPPLPHRGPWWKADQDLGRGMPRVRMRDIKVVGLIPRRMAAPPEP